MSMPSKKTTGIIALGASAIGITAFMAKKHSDSNDSRLPWKRS